MHQEPDPDETAALRRRRPRVFLVVFHRGERQPCVCVYKWRRAEVELFFFGRIVYNNLNRFGGRNGMG